jgi:6-phosphogluconolactonase (cycloisomerase 2 family)
MHSHAKGLQSFCLVLCLLAPLGLMVGCGGDSSNNTTGTSPTPTAPAGSAGVTPGSVGTGSGGGSTGGTVHSPQYLFVNNNQISGNTSVTEYSIDSSTGALMSIGNVTLASKNRVTDITTDITKSRLYVLDATSDAQPDSEVWTYSVDPSSGKVTQVSTTPYDAHAELAGPLIDINSRFMFTSEYLTPSLFHTLQLDPSTGAVTQQSETTQVSQSSSAVMYPAAEPSGKYVYAANPEANSVWGFSINGSSGTLTFVPGSPYTAGSTNRGCSPKMPVCTAPIVFANGFLYLVASAYPELAAFKINPSDGSLTPAAGSPFATGNTTYDAIATTPNGKFVYAVSNLSNVVAGWSIDPSTGVPTPIHGSPWNLGGNFSYWGAVVVDTTGRYLYASNSFYLSGWSIDQNTGALTPLSGSPFVTNGSSTTISILP